MLPLCGYLPTWGIPSSSNKGRISTVPRLAAGNFWATSIASSKFGAQVRKLMEKASYAKAEKLAASGADDVVKTRRGYGYYIQ